MGTGNLVDVQQTVALVSKSIVKSGAKTHSACIACSDVVGQERNVAWVTHQDDSLDHVDSCSLDSNCCAGNIIAGITAAAEGVIKYLGTLFTSQLVSSYAITSGRLLT